MKSKNSDLKIKKPKTPKNFSGFLGVFKKPKFLKWVSIALVQTLTSDI